MTQKRRITADRMRLWFPTEAASARLIYPYDDRDRVGPALVRTSHEIIREVWEPREKNTYRRVVAGFSVGSVDSVAMMGGVEG
ncbi:MAG: hypothetical protein IIA27_04760 [Gemmatimonadetes bacterium]|nr:hypothetical protein [Gemmatimonadota bacterium]